MFDGFVLVIIQSYRYSLFVTILCSHFAREVSIYHLSKVFFCSDKMFFKTTLCFWNSFLDLKKNQVVSIESSYIYSSYIYPT